MKELRPLSRHRRSDNKSQAKLIMGTLFLVGIIILFWYNLKDYHRTEEEKIFVNKEYVPEPAQGVIYHKPNFSLSYVEKYEIPEFVAYRLTVDMMNKKKFPREQDFNSDPAITEQSAHYHDYKNSGYRRGHLVPSADMAWDKNSMDATFLLSNVVPMREEFNNGIWLELEHNVRDWSRRYKNIMVVTGPVFNDSITMIGKNDVLVPRFYYKAIFKVENRKPEVIGFLFDQTIASEESIENFIVSIDSIEAVTGLDLFSNLYGSWEEEIRLEKQNTRTQGQWPFNEMWYLQRIENQ